MFSVDKWLDHVPDCPVCHASCTLDNIIPIYGRGRSSSNNVNRRSRPKAHRPPTYGNVPSANNNGGTMVCYF